MIQPAVIIEHLLKARPDAKSYRVDKESVEFAVWWGSH